MAKRMGRPTKYKTKFIQVVEKFIQDKIDAKSLPTLQGVAYELGIDDETLIEWSKLYPGFSATIKKLKQKQADILQLGIYEDSKQHGAGGIFLLKNNHGFKDRQDIDVTSGGKPLPLLGGLSKDSDLTPKD